MPGGGSAASTFLAQDAGGDKDESKNTDVSELWELYPIDPADAGTPLPTPEPGATNATDASGTVVNPAAEEPLRKVEGPPVARGDDVPIEGGGGVPAEPGGDAPGVDPPWSPALWAPWVALGAVVLVFAGGGAALAARRPHRAQGAVGAAAITPRAAATRSAPPVAGLAAQAGDATRGASSREHVRIHLLDGRRIEGWKKSGRVSQDNRVIVLDVDNVYDSSGHWMASTPLDSFVLPPQVDHIESLD